MKKVFCWTEKGLGPAVKTAIFVAGYTVAKKNRQLMDRILPAALAIKAQVDADGDNEALNVILKDALASLVQEASKDPIIQGAILGTLAQMNIDVAAGRIPAFDNASIRDMVDSFVDGMQALPASPPTS